MIEFSKHPGGGALVVVSNTVHNAVFTNTDYNTAAGRQSLISKSTKDIGDFIWKCVASPNTANSYLCIHSSGGTEGKIFYITLSPTDTLAPVSTDPGPSDLGVDLACQGEYCLIVQNGGTPGAKRLLAAPTINQTTLKCAGDGAYSIFIDIGESSNLSIHGFSTNFVIMKTNVDNTAFALSNNVMFTQDLSAQIAAGEFANDGAFLSYTGFTDKFILAIGTT